MLTIGGFSKIGRVSTKTLRYYDQIGLLKPEHVSPETGYRYYEVSQLEVLLLIKRLQQYQFSLPEIATVLDEQDNDYLAALLREKWDKLLSQITDQQHIRLRMEQDIQKIERRENIMQTGYLIKTIEFQPRFIFSNRQMMGLKDFGEVYTKLFTGMEESRIKPAGPFLSVYYDEEFNREWSDIEVGAVISETAGEHIRKLDPGLCCFADHIGPYDDFTPCYTALAEWMEREGYTASGPSIEIYIKGCDENIQPSAYVTQIYIPIRK